MRRKSRTRLALCGPLLFAVGCSSPDVSLGHLGADGAGAGNGSGGQRGDRTSGATSGSATSTGASVSSTSGSANSTLGDASLAAPTTSADPGILGSCPNPVEIDLSSGDGWADLRWTNALPAFIRPSCAIDDIPIYSGAPGTGPHTVWRALVFRYVV